MVRLEDILDKVSSYNPQANLDLIKKAYVFSGMVHKGQQRLSGEPYLSHPIEVAEILTALHMDTSTVATGLLHDTVEDTHTSIEKIKEVFGSEISVLVDGLTKISRMTFEKREDREAENYRKMILAMAKDIRVILVKLADRLHNMRTLVALPPEKQRKIARETLDIYAPLANRLGIGWMRAELEDLAFKYLEPEKFKELSEMVEKLGIERESYMESVKAQIEQRLEEAGIQCTVSGRPKHLYSIYQKMLDQDLEFDKIHDAIGFRVIVRSITDCYVVLGIIHSNWKPVPGRFKDYIGMPKPNRYQSLHTTVIGPYGERMEVQLRTEEMHAIAEHGIASHWKYKEGMEPDERDEKGFAWLSQLVEWQKDLTDSGEFMETVRTDLFPEEVFAFTPQGNVKVLPVGATPVDFAYAVHTDIGDRCMGVKIDGKISPLSTRLRNGNVVEIVTSVKDHPDAAWLDFVVTSKARTKIRYWLRAEEREKSASLGREICSNELKKYGIDFDELLDAGGIERVATEEFALKGVEALLSSVAYGRISTYQFLSKFVPRDQLEKRHERISKIRKVISRFAPRSRGPKEVVRIQGIENVMVKFAACCNPLPGEEITGIITHGQGVTVHSSGCSALLSIDPERRIEVAWEKNVSVARPVKIKVVCKNEKGLLARMSEAITKADGNVRSADIKTKANNKAINTFEIEVKDAKHLKVIMRSLQKVKKVLKVERVMDA